MPQSSNHSNIILIGAGIMSATLGVLLKKLFPEKSISIYERMDGVALESSDAWNNAGTGHSAFCELNYTPEKEDGSVDISKALKIASSYEISKQFWAYLVAHDHFELSENFIKTIPHMSFVWGEGNISYLQKRYNLLTQYALFEDMKFSLTPKDITEWIPLVMQQRNMHEPVACTYMQDGTDVNFGALTQALFKHIQQHSDVAMHLAHEVKTIDKQDNGTWQIKVKDLHTNEKKLLTADFVFIGAGGGSLPLLDKSNIKEGKGYGGFPVSGQWLKCTNENIIAQHHAKVYGKASVGEPPMSVPHLDTRFINGKKELLFGPYAGFSTKFLKNGSYLDLPLSVEMDNILPMISAGLHNIPLTKYLIEQVRQSPEDRLNALREYLPDAQMQDWELAIAGQRVQIIKSDEEEGGVLEFGTEIITSEDGSLACLLGASPGASTSVSIMLDVVKKCFGDELKSAESQATLLDMIPTYGKDLINDASLCKATRARTNEILHL
jgi:malate dehydrogenase (quinone)